MSDLSVVVAADKVTKDASAHNNLFHWDRYSAMMQIDGVNYLVDLDTGSGDLWIAAKVERSLFLGVHLPTLPSRDLT